MITFAHKVASKNNWRIPEYTDEEWQPSLEAGKLCNDGRRYHEGYVTGHPCVSASRCRCAGLRPTAGPYPTSDGTGHRTERARVDGWHRRPWLPTAVNDQGRSHARRRPSTSRVACARATTYAARCFDDDGIVDRRSRAPLSTAMALRDYIHDTIAQPAVDPPPAPTMRAFSPPSSCWDVSRDPGVMAAIRVSLWPTALAFRAASSTTPRSRHPTRNPGTKKAAIGTGPGRVPRPALRKCCGECRAILRCGGADPVLPLLQGGRCLCLYCRLACVSLFLVGWSR